MSVSGLEVAALAAVCVFLLVVGALLALSGFVLGIVAGLCLMAGALCVGAVVVGLTR